MDTINKIIQSTPEEQDLRGKEAPKHIEYYDYIYKLKTDPNSFIKLEKVIHGNVTGEYDLHLINLANKQRFVVKSTEMTQKLNVTHSGKTKFGNVISVDGTDTSQVLLSSGADAFTSYGNNNLTNPLLGPPLPIQTGEIVSNVNITDEQLLGYNTPILPQPSQLPQYNNSGFKHRHTIERIKKETEVVELRFDNMPNKTFIKMFVENLDMDENETKEFNKELANYVFEANKKSIMESIKEYYQMNKEVKRGRPQGAKTQNKKKKTTIETKENNLSNIIN